MPYTFVGLEAPKDEDENDDDPKPHKDGSSDSIEHMMYIMRVPNLSDHCDDDVDDAQSSN